MAYKIGAFLEFFIKSMLITEIFSFATSIYFACLFFSFNGRKTVTKLTYAPYYLRAIERYLVGLKQASGPTGIGKTSVIGEVIHSPICGERKSIYLANRKQ